MAELERQELSVRAERAVLVALETRDIRFEREPLQELASLASTAGAEVVGRMAQRRPAPDTTFYIGRGKAEELRDLVRALDADVVIFDADLKPAQVRQLEELTQIKVIDRTELILDIFATRARTTQAKLQVELAQLEYAFPRLRAMWKHLERIEGGIGARGPGEQQLESDRRIVRKRIESLRKSLLRIEDRTEREIRHRSEFLTISIVGYTNAGKSTLMNALTDAGAFVEDRLFATLDTRTRLWEIARGRRAFLSDTVGFIRDLPHHLVASFHATLAEAREAHLLLHVADVSHSDVLQQVESVEAVLREMGCQDKPRVTVLNKCDIVRGHEGRVILDGKLPETVLVSARTGAGLEELRERVAGFVDSRSERSRISWAAGDGRILPYLSEHATILEHGYSDSTEFARVQALPAVLGKLHKLFEGVRFEEGYRPRGEDDGPAGE
ncbi:MAG: GTPase HflX [Planctomycetota bacterium]